MWANAGRFVALVLAPALFAVGCGSDPEDHAARERQTPEMREGRSARAGASPETVSAPAPLSETPELPALPGAGAIFVEVTQRGVTALANEAPQLEVLRRLESAVGFALVLGEIDEDRPISLRLADDALEVVLAQALTGIPYRLRYEVDETTGGHSLAVVAAGDVGRRGLGAEERMELRRRGRETIERKRREMEEQERRAQALSPEERERLRQETLEERRESEAQIARDLESPDAWVRAEAAQRIEAVGEGIGRLGEILASDPDVQVRVAAANQLSDSDSAGSTNSLLAALDDPSSEVVIEALESLQFVGDESLIPAIQPMLTHPDAQVREIAADTIDFLE